MFSRFLLLRSTPLRLSATLTTRVCSRSLSTWRLVPSARCTVSPLTSSRRFSAASRAEYRDDMQTSHAPSGTCYIANIPYKITAEELKEAFSEFGKIKSVKLITSDAGLSRGIGFVQFESVADAVSFVEANEADPIFVLDRQLQVEHSRRSNSVGTSDTLMLLHSKGESTVEVRAMFGDHADSIIAVRFNKKEAGQPLRNAFVQFRDSSEAAEAIEAFKSRNQNVSIRYARQRQPPTNSDTLVSRLSQIREH